MERGSTQHSPRLDEAMAAETDSITAGAPVEARARDARLMEGAADGEPEPDARVGSDRFEAPGGALPTGGVEARSQLAVSLRPSAFPADRAALVAVAREEHAPPAVIDALARLRPDARFENVQQVWAALGGEVEVRDVEVERPDAERADAERADEVEPAAERRADEVEPDAERRADEVEPAEHRAERRGGDGRSRLPGVADKARDLAVGVVATAVRTAAAVGRRVRELIR